MNEIERILGLSEEQAAAEFQAVIEMGLEAPRMEVPVGALR